MAHIATSKSRWKVQRVYLSVYLYFHLSFDLYLYIHPFITQYLYLSQSFSLYHSPDFLSYPPPLLAIALSESIYAYLCISLLSLSLTPSALFLPNTFSRSFCISSCLSFSALLIFQTQTNEESPWSQKDLDLATSLGLPFKQNFHRPPSGREFRVPTMNMACLPSHPSQTSL